jgi:purine-binding chemotaxis protein CheW
MSELSQSQSVRFISFSLAKQIFAIPLLGVKEVIGFTESTTIPGAPTYFKGIINLRGQIISVIDLRLKLKMPKADIGPEASIMILDLGEINLGVVVDSIESVLNLEGSNISPPPDMNAGAAQQFVTGVAKTDNKLVLILDINRTLNTEDFKLLKSNNENKIDQHKPAQKVA